MYVNVFFRNIRARYALQHLSISTPFKSLQFYYVNLPFICVIKFTSILLPPLCPCFCDETLHSVSQSKRPTSSRVTTSVSYNVTSTGSLTHFIPFQCWRDKSRSVSFIETFQRSNVLLNEEQNACDNSKLCPFHMGEHSELRECRMGENSELRAC